MKKFIIAATLICTHTATTKAQNLLSKVPSSAAAVMKYSGENLSKNVPLQKIDGYDFVKKYFFKVLNIDTLSSLQNLGINFEQDSYQYVSLEDSSLSIVTLLHLKNAPQFLQLLTVHYGAHKRTPLKTENKNGFDFLKLADDSYVGWNNNIAVVVHTSYQNKKDYYAYGNWNNSDTTMVAVDSAVSVMVDTTMPVKTLRITKDKKIITGKTTFKSKPGVKQPIAKKKPATKKIINEAPKEYDAYHIQDSINNLKRELWNEQQDLIAAKKQYAVAENILAATFAGNINSIENEISYKKIIDPAAHLSAWINTESLTAQYFNYFSARSYYSLLGSKYKNDTTEGFKSAINVYFEKDKMRIEQKSFSKDPVIESMGLDVMNSKQNPALANYVNPGNIGYFSASINTEAMANYYYTLLKKYLHSYPYISNYSDIADLYIDLLQIVIDEKGIADLMPGNYLFVMHDLKSRMVTYTDYEYDKDFKQTEVKKTKKELAPDFTFIMETKKQGFLEKIAKLPLKYVEKGKYNYKDKGGYYELAFEEGKLPISSLYFMVKDGKAIVTTSKDVVDMTLNNTAFAVDADTKKSILNNNYSFKLNSKVLLEKIGTEFNSATFKKISDYLMENIGDIKSESSVKDGMIQSTTLMNTGDKNSNSLEFFFNMIESINNIIEKDKHDKGKTLN